MALCLASSLMIRQDFIPYDQLVRYKWWFRNGYMSATGKCFDIGAATKRSLVEFEDRQKGFARKYNISSDEIDYLTDSELLKQFNVDCSEKDVAGNGALMRLTPVPLFFHRHPKHAVEFSGASGRITHGDLVAYDACRYYGALIVAALNGASKNDLLDDNFYAKHIEWFNAKPLHADIMDIAQGSYKKEGGYKDGIRGKGYIVDSLKAALWAFWSNKDSFEKGALAAVNLGDDADTTAAIYGQLAGAYHGYEQLPQKWLDHLYAQKFIRCLSMWIVYEGENWQPKKSLASLIDITIPHSQINTASSSTKQKPDFGAQPSTSKSTGKTKPEPNRTDKRPSNVTSTQSINVTTAPNKHKTRDDLGKSDWNSDQNNFSDAACGNSTQRPNSTTSRERKVYILRQY
jgi:ADP-ribosyl-[dinitrogen reductase] hydrolase